MIPSACAAYRRLPALRSLASLFLVSTTSLAVAQAQLAPIVVTGTREPEPLQRLGADLVVIDRDTIERSNADSLEDLLRREAGVQVVRSGGPGQNAGFFIRGASTNSTVVLVDGVRVGSATLGQADLAAFGLAGIERVEVLRGPASSLYGADAVGGVIHVITRRAGAEPRADAAVAIGGYGAREASVGVSRRFGDVDLAASLARQQSRGVSALRPGDVFASYNPDRDGFARSTAQLGAGFTPADGHRIGISVFESRLRADYDGALYAPPDFLPDASPDFRNRLKTSVYALDYRGAITAAWTTTLQVARNVDELESGADVPDRFRTRRTQTTWQNAFRFAPGQQVVVAYEHLDERARASGYVEPVARRGNALVLGYAGTFGAASLQADLRRDHSSIYDDVTSGRLGGSVEFAPGWRVRASWGTTFRAPSFNDLHYPGYGIPTLRPERGRSIEAGVSWRTDAGEVSATLWRNRVRNLIGPELDVERCPGGAAAFQFGCAANVGRARLQGLTLGASRRWGGLDVRASLDLLDAVDARTGERLPRRAAHQETLAADYRLGDWSVGASLLGVGSRPDNGVVLGGYGVLDLRATWRVAPGWRVEARVLNAGDKDVEPIRDYRGLGRQGWIGVRFEG